MLTVINFPNQWSPANKCSCDNSGQRTKVIASV